MHKLEELRDNLCEELERVAKKEEITTSDLDTIDKLAHSIKNLDKIMYSGRAYEHYSYGPRYDRSYARRGRDGDNDGRYNEGYSRDIHSRNMTDRLHEMMDETSSDREREVIMRCISKLEN